MFSLARAGSSVSGGPPRRRRAAILPAENDDCHDAFASTKKNGAIAVPARTRFGNVGEALFFGSFLVVGCLALWAAIHFLVVPEWRANRHFVETTCTVLSKHLGQSSEAESPRWRPEVEIEYQVDGQTYRPTIYDAAGMYSISRDSAEQKLDRFEVGQEYPCWYDPIDPGRAVLVQGYSRLALSEPARPRLVHRHQHAAADLHLDELEHLGRAPQRDVAPGRQARSLGLAGRGAGPRPVRRQLDQ